MRPNAGPGKQPFQHALARPVGEKNHWCSRTTLNWLTEGSAESPLNSSAARVSVVRCAPVQWSAASGPHPQTFTSVRTGRLSTILSWSGRHVLNTAIPRPKVTRHSVRRYDVAGDFIAPAITRDRVNHVAK